MKLSIFQKIFILTFLMLAGLTFIILAIQKNSTNIQNTSRWVAHTHQVISESESLLSLTKDLETSSRGYVITSDSFYLEPLFFAEKVIFQSIQKIKQLTSDNSSQQERIIKLESYVKERLRITHQSIAIKNNSGLNEAIKFISNRSGQIYSNKIRQTILEIQNKELELLKARQELSNESLNTLNTLKIFLIATISTLLLLFLIAVGYSLIEGKEKEKRVKELAITHKELHFQEHQKLIQEEANKELEAFSYSVSHDLRAPLRHISGYVDLLLKKNLHQLDESGQRYLTTISESSKEMGDLIDALLTFSRLSRTEIQKTKINTRLMVDRILKTHTQEMGKREIQFIIDDLPDCVGNENLINQVWFNLISNAIKYTRYKQKSIIEIGFETKINEIIYFIKDNGAGFDMKYANKLFGVFQRLHKSSEFEGIGIGLANINRIVNRHNGKCNAEGNVGMGATFYFSLPILT